VEQATKEDAAENYAHALQLYQAGLDYFVKAMDVERNPDIKENIKEKLTQYVKRAEEIKQALELQRQQPPQLQKGQKGQTVKLRLGVSLAAAPYVESAIQSAIDASEDDECGRTDQAMTKYQLTISQFSLALKTETNADIQAMIKDKLIKYSSRMEQLKQFQATGSLVPSPIPFGLSQDEKKYQAPALKKKKSGLFGKKREKNVG